MVAVTYVVVVKPPLPSPQPGAPVTWGAPTECSGHPVWLPHPEVPEAVAETEVSEAVTVTEISELDDRCSSEQLAKSRAAPGV